MARDELADVLAPFVRFTKSGEFLLEPEYNGLNARRKVACALLAFRAAQLLGLRESGRVAPKDVAATTGLPPGTVRPKLVELARDRVVVGAGGRYEVPVHALRRAAAIVNGAA